MIEERRTEVLLAALKIAQATIERLDARAKAPSAMGTLDVIRAAIAGVTEGDSAWQCPINYPGCEKNCGNYGCGN